LVFEPAQASPRGRIAIGEGSGRRRIWEKTPYRDPGCKPRPSNLLEFFACSANGNELRFDTYTVQLEGFPKGAVIVASDYNTTAAGRYPCSGWT
jgi:hypothetical protein